MKLSEITGLIEIRSYISSAVNNYSLHRDKVKQLNEMLILIDARIVEKLLSKDFKEFLHAEDKDVERLVSEARRVSDIKSGMAETDRPIPMAVSYIAPNTK
jgi:hypothetical protein